MQYTTNYNLKEPQYADEADIEKINENTEAIDNLIHQNRTMIAPAFDNTKAYVTGDPVEYLGALYVFTADKAAGAWDASKVEPTTAAEMGGGGASALADLNDVEITSPTEGQILTYDDDNDEWVNSDMPDASVTKEASGNPIELTDAAAAPIVKCVTQITGYQEGTGTPSPENVRPIVAYTEGEIEVRGKNMLPSRFGTDTAYGVTFTKNSDGTYTLNGTSTKDSSFDIYLNNPNGSHTDKSYDITIQPGTYKFSGISGGSKSTYRLYASLDEEGQSTTYVGTNDGEGYFTTTSTTQFALFIRIYYGMTFNNMKIYPMLRNSVGTDSTFEPYTSTTHTTTYPNAIYRGSEDVVNGEVVTEWGMIASYAGETLPGEWISDRDEYVPGTTPTTGAQVAYELATPTTSSVTPTNLPIKSLSGYNHIESSTGDMEIEYITKTYEPLVDLIERSDHIYSTQEQVVGTWVDGSTVYERTIDKSSSPVTVHALQWEVFDTLPEKVNVIDGFSFNYETVGSGTEYTTTPMIFNCDISGHLNVFNVRQNTGMTVMIVTIRYTKASSNRSLSAPVTSQKSISEPLTDKAEEVPTEEEKTVEKPETEEENNEAER